MKKLEQEYRIKIDQTMINYLDAAKILSGFKNWPSYVEYSQIQSTDNN